MKETDPKPALRISHIVYGRQLVGNRVYYRVDPKGISEFMAVPETVVLKRWRARQFPGYTFSGTRLSSTLWRAVGLAFGGEAKRLCRLTPAAISEVIDLQRTALRSQHYALPAPDALHALFAVLGPDRLQAVLDRHLAPERGNLSGIPDLFLFATPTGSKKPGIARFVEVKKPEEVVSKEQLAEIDFLNGLGLHARVLRLLEPTLSNV